MTTDPWVPRAFDFEVEDPEMERTDILPDLPPPPNKDSGQSGRPEQTIGPAARTPDRATSGPARWVDRLDRATGPGGLPVVGPVARLARAVPAGRSARAAARAAEVGEPKMAWLKQWGSALDATETKAQAGDLNAHAEYEKWAAKLAIVEAEVEERQAESDKKLLIRRAVIAVTALFCLFDGLFGWLPIWPRLVFFLPWIAGGVWFYRTGRAGLVARTDDRASGPGRPEQTIGRPARTDDRAGLPRPEHLSGPVARTPDRAGPGHETGRPGPPGPRLHPRAVELEVGLRAYGLIDKKDEIQAWDPLPMCVGDRPSNGSAFTVKLPLSCPSSKVVENLHSMATALDTTDDKLILLPAGGSNRLLWIWICESHPLGGPGTWSPLQEAPEVNVWEGWQIGWSILGDPVMASLVGDRLLAAGTTGCGKSASINVILAGYALDPHAQMLLMDPEGFGAWTPLARVARVMQGSDPDTLRAMAEKLRWIVEVEFLNRQAEIQRIRVEQPDLLDDDQVNEKVSRDRRYKLPALLIAIEEVTSLVNATDKYTRETSRWALGEIARRCRKYGITLVLASQKPTNDQLPSFIVAMCTSQYLMACSRPTQADAVIPDWRDLGMQPMQMLQPDDRKGGGTPGAGYYMGTSLVEPSTPWVLMRTDYISGATFRAMIDRAFRRRLEIRPELLPAEAVTTPMAPAAYPGLDPGPLRELESVFEPDEYLSTKVVAERLQSDFESYGDLGISGDAFNDWWRPYGIRFTRITVGDSRPRVVSVHDVRRRLAELDRGVPGQPGSGRVPEPWTLSGTPIDPVRPQSPDQDFRDDEDARGISGQFSDTPPIPGFEGVSGR